MSKKKCAGCHCNEIAPVKFPEVNNKFDLLTEYTPRNLTMLLWENCKGLIDTSSNIVKEDDVIGPMTTLDEFTDVICSDTTKELFTSIEAGAVTVYENLCDPEVLLKVLQENWDSLQADVAKLFHSMFKSHFNSESFIRVYCNPTLSKLLVGAK